HPQHRKPARVHESESYRSHERRSNGADWKHIGSWFAVLLSDVGYAATRILSVISNTLFESTKPVRATTLGRATRLLNVMGVPAAMMAVVFWLSTMDVVPPPLAT